MHTGPGRCQTECKQRHDTLVVHQWLALWVVCSCAAPDCQEQSLSQTLRPSTWHSHTHVGGVQSFENVAHPQCVFVRQTICTALVTMSCYPLVSLYKHNPHKN